MKKIIVLLVFIVSAVSAYSQNDSIAVISPEVTTSSMTRQEVSPLLMNDAYKNTAEWGKYKALRAVGWTTFGVGMTATCVGGWLYLLLGNINGSEKAYPGTIVFCSGLGLTVASIPILVSAYHYRDKAKKIGMSMGVTQLTTPTPGQNLSYTPAMNFTITF